MASGGAMAQQVVQQVAQHWATFEQLLAAMGQEGTELRKVGEKRFMGACNRVPAVVLPLLVHGLQQAGNEGPGQLCSVLLRRYAFMPRVVEGAEASGEELGLFVTLPG